MVQLYQPTMINNDCTTRPHPPTTLTPQVLRCDARYTPALSIATW